VQRNYLFRIREEQSTGKRLNGKDELKRDYREIASAINGSGLAVVRPVPDVLFAADSSYNLMG
jgi:hypothetical protein